jgi:hypothetical protein
MIATGVLKITLKQAISMVISASVGFINKERTVL